MHFRECKKRSQLILFCLLGVLSAGPALAQDKDFYYGYRLGLLTSSPGTYSDNFGAGAILGYQPFDCCWALEAEVTSTLTRSNWYGTAYGLYIVRRFGQIGGSGFIFFPKFKLGIQHSNYIVSGVASDSNSLAGGFGWEIGDSHSVFEFEISGVFDKNLGSDELAFLSINMLYPF